MLQKGFTLIELLVYMGLLSILLIALTGIFTSLIDVQLNSQTASYTAQDGRYLYSRLIYDINRADTVQTPASLGDSANSLVLTVAGATYTYALSGSQLVMTDVSGSYAMNSPETAISNLTFQRIGNVNDSDCPQNTCKDTFRINFTIASNRNDDSSPEIKNFQTTAGLR